MTESGMREWPRTRNSRDRLYCSVCNFETEGKHNVTAERVARWDCSPVMQICGLREAGNLHNKGFWAGNCVTFEEGFTLRNADRSEVICGGGEKQSRV